MKLLFVLAIMTDLTRGVPSHDARRFRFFNKGADMSVIVRGNSRSEPLIVFLHGGPGGSAALKIGERAFEILEEDYRVVYWDQRGSGHSRGGAQKRYMNVEQYVEDLDMLVEILRRDYPSASIFLLGHSWGGCLGTAYLADHARQAKIKGWIDVAGAHNNPRADSLSMEWVKDKARQRIATHESRLYWKYALRWYEKNPGFSSANLMHYQFVKRANGYVHSKRASGRLPGYSVKDWIISPRVPIHYYRNYLRTLSRLIISEIDLTPVLKQIVLPTLIIWGSDDGLVPSPIAYETYANLGTPAANKSLVIFERTAHTVYYEQQQLFPQHIRRFIDGVEAGRTPVLKIANKNLN